MLQGIKKLISSKLFLFLLGVVFAASSSFAWQAFWHGTDWIKTGETIRSKEIAEMLQYLYERTIPPNMPACNGENEALQWDGTKIVCGTITASSTTNVTNTVCEEGSYRGGECYTTYQDQCRICRVCTDVYKCVNNEWVFVRSGSSGCQEKWACISSCFTPGTLITMADGSKKPISEIKIGEKVRSASGGSNTVLGFETPKLGTRSLYAFNDSEDYFVTAEHPFLTEDGWKAIDPEATKREKPSIAKRLNITKLEVGDVIITENGKIKIEKIKSKSADPNQTVYNLILDGDHTYIANGFVVHNKD